MNCIELVSRRRYHPSTGNITSLGWMFKFQSNIFRSGFSGCIFGASSHALTLISEQFAKLCMGRVNNQRVQHQFLPSRSSGSNKLEDSPLSKVISKRVILRFPPV